MPILRLTTYFLAVLLPFEALRLPGELELVRSTGFICLIGLSLDVMQRIWKGQSIKIHGGNDIWLLFAFLAVALISVTYSDNKDAGLSLYANFISLTLLFLFVRVSINHLKYLDSFLIFLCCGFVLSSLLAYFSGQGLFSVGSENALELRLYQTRFSGFLRNPNRYSYHGLLVFWAAVLLFSVVGRRRLFSLLVMLFCSVAIIFSGSRGSIGGLLIGWLAFFFLSQNKNGGLAKIFLAAVGLLILEIFWDSFLTLVPRFATETLLNSGSSVARLYLWTTSVESISTHPILGAGLGSLDGVIGEAGFPIHDPHNIFLFTMQFFGIPGIVILFLSIFGVARKSIKIQAKGHSEGFLTLAFLLSMLVPGMFHTILFWKAYILALCLIVIVQRSIHWQPAELKKFIAQ